MPLKFLLPILTSVAHGPRTSGHSFAATILEPQTGWVLFPSWDMVALVASIPLLLSLGVIVWRHRDLPAAIPMLGLLAIRGSWALCRIQILLITEPAQAHLWYALTSAFVVLSVSIGLSVVFEFIGPGTWLARRNLTLVLLPGIFCAVLFVLGSEQGWFWRNLGIENVFYYERTNWTWIIALYFYGYALAAMYALVRFAQRLPIFRQSAIIMLVALIASILIDFLLGARLLGRSPIDPGILTFIFAITLYTVAIIGRRSFLDVMPLARDTALAQMHDGVAVLNTKGRVIFQNPVAQEVLASRTWEARDEHGPISIGADAEVLDLFSASQRLPISIIDEMGATRTHYTVRITPLNDPRGWRLGNLLVLHDITDRVRAQELLIQQQRTMAIREERERIAAELHDDLGQVLGFVKLQAQATRELLATNRGEGADQALVRLLAVAQDAHTDIREFILGASASSTLDLGFVPALRGYLKQFSENFGLPAHLSLLDGEEEIELRPGVALQLLRIVQEALTNARKHAHASSVTVTITMAADELQVEVADDGTGIQPEQIRHSAGSGFGIGLIRKRAESIGGTLEMHSTPNAGTRVVVSVPYVGIDA